MDIAKALEFGWPGKEFSVGETYESLVCIGWEKPSLEAITAAWRGYLAKREDTAWLRGRVSEYPSIQEVVEALAEKEEGRPEKWLAITAQRQAIKAKYPKPAGGQS